MTTLGFTTELSHNSKLASGLAARSLNATQLRSQLIRLRAYLREFVCGLSDAQTSPPRINGINPPLWEAAHVAWFAEWWCVRDAYNTESGETRADHSSVWDGCDAFLNSAAIAHAARWAVPQLSRAATLDYLDRSLEVTLARLARAEPSDQALYPFRLAMFHEAMHLEAIAWCAQALAWPMPAWVDVAAIEHPTRALRDELQLQSQLHLQSSLLNASEPASGFTFDNERIAPAPTPITTPLSTRVVTNAEFAAFVESGAFMKALSVPHPQYWRHRPNGAWQQRRFDCWADLAPDEPVVHVSAIEAEAFAAHHQARLPTEVELAKWLTLPNDAAWHGAVWEWTSSKFEPYRGFTPDRYREYSAPWFDGRHRVLRGGSFATLDIMHHPSYRNFFLPHRSDVFAGFRVVRSEAF